MQDTQPRKVEDTGVMHLFLAYVTAAAAINGVLY
jgi:hypothetical protein